MSAGLARIAATLHAGPGTVAYLGASVTAQREGYRPALHEGLVALTGHEHRMVNAGIGGVGAISGLFLMDELVLAHGPAVCFVEFATTDIIELTPPAQLGAVLTAMAVKLRAIGCEPCFLLLPRAETSDAARARVRARYAQVAADQDVALIDLGAAGAALRDVVHVTTEGAAMLARAVVAAIAVAAGDAEPARPAAPGALASAYARGRVVAATAEHAVGPVASGRFRLTHAYVRVAEPGRLRVMFPEALVGLVVVVGPTSQALALGDRRIELRDEWCTYDRLSTVVLDPEHPPGAPAELAPARGGDLKVIGFMVRP